MKWSTYFAPMGACILVLKCMHPRKQCKSITPIGRESGANLVDVSSIEIFQAMPTEKIKMAAVRPDVIGMPWFELDISKFPRGTCIYEDIYSETYANTLRRRDDWLIG